MNKLVLSAKSLRQWSVSLKDSALSAQENITYILVCVPFYFYWVPGCKNFVCSLLFPPGCGSGQDFWGDTASLWSSCLHMLSCVVHPSLFHNLNQNILEWLILNPHVSKIQWSVQCNQQENQVNGGKWRIAAEQPLHLRDRDSSGFIFVSTSNLFWKCIFTISDVMYQLNQTLCEIQKENFLF